MKPQHHPSKKRPADPTRPSHPPRPTEPLEPRTLLSAGDLDPTFCAAGRAWANFPALAQETARQAARQSDGKILVLVTDTASPGHSLLTRYDASGKPDTTFGAGGTVPLPFKPGAFAVRADDRIVLAAYANDPDAANGLLLARYTPAGQPDPTFGGGDGVVEQPLFGTPGNNQFKNIARLLVRPDNSLIVAGNPYRDAQADFALQAFTPAGDPDLFFGASGIAITDNALYDTLADATLTPDGKIVAVGSAGNFDAHHPFLRFALARLTPTARSTPPSASTAR